MPGGGADVTVTVAAALLLASATLLAVTTQVPAVFGATYDTVLPVPLMLPHVLDHVTLVSCEPETDAENDRDAPTAIDALVGLIDTVTAAWVVYAMVTLVVWAAATVKDDEEGAGSYVIPLAASEAATMEYVPVGMSGSSTVARGTRFKPCPVIVTSASTPLGSPVMFTWTLPTSPVATVIVALAALDVSATLRAVTMHVCDAVLGAVYVRVLPAPVITPQLGVNDQVTDVFAAPVTDAVNGSVPPGATVAVAGLIDTDTPGADASEHVSDTGTCLRSPPPLKVMVADWLEEPEQPLAFTVIVPDLPAARESMVGEACSHEPPGVP